MRKLLVFFCLGFSSIIFASNSSKVCQNLYSKGCSVGTRVDYRLNMQAYEDCLKAFSQVNTKEIPSHKVSVSVISTVGRYPFYRLDIQPRKKKVGRRVLLTSGIHGNEAVGPVALVGFLRRALKDPQYQNTSFRVYPMLNPWGLDHCTRKNAKKKDLNRELHKKSPFSLYTLLKSDLKGQVFDVGVDMHEAGGRKFFLLSQDQMGIEKATASLKGFPLQYLKTAAKGVYPFKKSSSPYTFYSPGVGSSLNVHTVKSFMRYTLKIPFSFTTEAPLDFPLVERTRIYEKFVKTLVDSFPTETRPGA